MKNIFLLAGLLLGFAWTGYSEENLFLNPGLQGSNKDVNPWGVMAPYEVQPDSVLKLYLKRDRKEFMDNGISQTFNDLKPGWYDMSISLKGDGLTCLSCWIQIKMSNGKYVYRVQTVPLKNKITNWESYNYVFDIPEDAVSVYVQFCVRTCSDNKNGAAYVTKPVFKATTKPVETTKQISVATILTEKYLKQIAPSIPKTHPRLFYSPAILAEMKRKAASPEIKPYFEKMKKVTEKTYRQLLEQLTIDDGLGKEPAGRRYHPLENWGNTAACGAILYRITGEKKWADMSIDLLKKLTSWYNKRFKLERAVSWYGFGRISTVMAWDWLYDEMTPEDRATIGNELVAHTRWLNDLNFISMMCPKGEGANSSNSGFYSANCMLPWYAGIAFRGEGYDDAFMERQLEKGLAGHLEMLTYRNNMAGDDGGSVNSSPSYCYGTYNNVEFWFFISWKALTGKNISADFPQMSLFPFWLNYTIFRGIDNLPYDFGTGGEWHINNVFTAAETYHALFRNFYQGPVCELSDEMLASRPWPKNGYTRYDWLIYYSPFYLFYDNCDLKNHKCNEAFYASLPKAYFFENLGQCYMHSGWTGKDTHVMFTCGSKSGSHKEMDENNFVIYKGGFLALDSGARTFDFTDEGRRLYYAHNSNYKDQSIAHNVILIRMEGEKFNGWRIDPKDVGNHEGMIKSTGGIVRAYETNNDFTYIAGDSTACYHPGKAKQVIRQFVMIYPDMFVIYDTVKSVMDDQKKTWQLHTQEEPKISGNTFEVIQREGRLICHTLLPEKAKLEKIGGPGKEFWSDGKNFPLGSYLEKNIADSRKRGYDTPLWGAWRIFITDPVEKVNNTFLNVIQVGLKKELTKIVDAKLIKEKELEGTCFTFNGVEYVVLFDPVKVPAGHIKAIKNGQVLYDRSFSDKIQPQKAIDYLK